MLILERSVTKHYWLKMYRYLYRKIQRGNYERVSSFSGLKILHFQCGRDCKVFAVVTKHNDELRPIAWLYLWRKPGWTAWEVLQVFVFEKLRGQGLSKRLYQAAINTSGIMIASGKSQSKSSRALWRSFIEHGTFDIFAIDFWNLQDRSEVFWDAEQEELWCDFEIYFSGPIQDRDVRLIATKRKT